MIGNVVGQQRRDAEEGGVVRRQHIGRDARHEAAEAPFGLEALAKRRQREQLAQPRHDAAADVDAAAGAQGQCEVRGHRAQHAAEALDGLAAKGAQVVQRTLGDVGRVEVGFGGGMAGAQREVDQLDAGPRDQPLGRHARHRLPRVLQHAQLALVGGREADVAAFGGEHRPAVAGGNEARHAEAGARSQQADHAVGLRLAAADLHAAVGADARQRHRQRGEIVDDEQRVQLQLALRFLDREGPVAVGHSHPVAFDRVGDGHCAVPRHDAGQREQIGLHDSDKAAVVLAAQHRHMVEASPHPLDAEARIGRPDVCQQARFAVGQGVGAA